MNVDQRMENIALGEGEDELIHDQLPTVEDYKAQQGLQSSEKSLLPLLSHKKFRFGLTLAALIVVVVVGTLAGVAVNNRNRTPNHLDEVVSFIRSQSNSEAVFRYGSPQQKAAEWMALIDEKNLPLDDRFMRRYALMVLYYATGGDSTWIFDFNFGHPKRDECYWTHNFRAADGTTVQMGVFCDPSDRIVGIKIMGNALSGELPPEIALLTDLKEIYLDSNNIAGTLPSSIQELSHLFALSLASNSISSTIPEWLGQLTNLNNLVLTENEFDSTFPSSMTSMTSLRALAIERNYLVGDLSVIAQMPWLEELYLGENDLTGIVSNGFLPDLRNLTVLDLSGNDFRGDVARGLLRRQKLRYLDMHNNRLSGKLPDIPKSTSLEFLAIQRNSIGGPIPDTISELSKLTHLDLSNNQFRNAMPAKLGSLTNLEFLFLGNNLHFSPGPIEENMRHLTNLKELSLRLSQRNGELPSWIGELTDLVVLDVSENALEGSVPEALGNLTNLEFLIIRKNNLNGRFPKLNAMPNLAVIVMDNTTIAGIAGALCDSEKEEFIADCGGNFPEFRCACCTKCCHDSSVDCSEDVAIPLLDENYNKHYFDDGEQVIVAQQLPAKSQQGS